MRKYPDNYPNVSSCSSSYLHKLQWMYVGKPDSPDLDPFHSCSTGTYCMYLQMTPSTIQKADIMFLLQHLCSAGWISIRFHYPSAVVEEIKLPPCEVVEKSLVFCVYVLGAS